MFLIPWCASISKLDLLGFWSMIDFLFELGVGFFYVWYVRSRLGLIIYFVRRTKNLNYEDYEYSYLFQWSLTKSRRC
jgi:hypothetical protein